MKRWTGSALFLLIIVCLAGGQTGTPVAQAAPVAPSLSVNITPTAFVPAQGGMVQISGRYPLDVSIQLEGEPLAVYWTGSEYLALIAFGFDAAPGEYELDIEVIDPVRKTQYTHTETLKLTAFSYPIEQVVLPWAMTYLLEEEINQNEFAKLDAIYAARTQPLRWDWPFALPVPGGVVTSRFGGNRFYNGGMLNIYHTGTDFRRFVGDPVHATAGGTVVTAEYFDIRGNVVIIDHGFGVFSQYAHLSELFVAKGDTVRQGQLIAAGGNTGRSSGPHLHFEIIVNSTTVEPIRWLSLNPDFVPPIEVSPVR